MAQRDPATQYSSTPVTVDNINTAVEVAVGDYHACARLSDGALRCWGYNWSGQLATGAVNAGGATPVIPLGSAGKVFTNIQAGRMFTCAKTDEAKVYCWGANNGSGAVGNGLSTDVTSLFEVPTLGNVAQLVVGDEQSCVRTDTGSLRCWGKNSGYSVTTTTGYDAAIRSPVDGRSGPWSNLFASYAGFCALDAGSDLWCWGGEYGAKEILPDETMPQDVFGLNTNVADIEVGREHTCAIKNNGEVWCWGRYLLDYSSNINPTQIAGLNASALSLGNYVSCAILSDRTVSCWGYGGYGGYSEVLGTPSNIPVQITGISGAEKLWVGDRAACALDENGKVFCWGMQNYGELGSGVAKYSRSEATEIQGLGVVTAMAGGAYHVCALSGGNQVSCWGNNSSAQLGSNTWWLSTPRVVLGAANLTSVVANVDFSCGLSSTGTVTCWGSSYPGFDTPQPFTDLEGAKSISIGPDYLCGTYNNSNIKCYNNGYNDSGYFLPLGEIADTSDIIDVAVGYYSVCALSSLGTVRCRGYNWSGQLGTGDNSDSPDAFVEILGLTTAKQIATSFRGNGAYCALKENGRVVCWGSNDGGILAQDPNVLPTSLAPIEVAGLNNTVSIALGVSHACAATALGKVFCWGDNSSGQLGQDIVVTQSFVPLEVPGLSNISSVSANDYNTCAATIAGTLHCFGNGTKGHMGNGTDLEFSNTPTQVLFSNDAKVKR